MGIPNRTKIVATMGPVSREEGVVEQLIKAGVDVFRLNCAHSSHKAIGQDVRTIRRVARKLKQPIGILVDLQGPKIRVGRLHNAEPIWLQRNQRVTISTEVGLVGAAGVDGAETCIGTNYPRLARDVRPKERVLLDDGNIELVVVAVDGELVRTKVIYGGLLKQHKGINLPGSKVSATTVSDKDLADLRCALAAGVDYIALSFVRTAADIAKLRPTIRESDAEPLVIAKIERPEAVKNLASIVAEADGLMIARGDMGVELGPEAVPALQKRIIRMAIEAKKPVITATQMLESMISSPRATRAEASDVANAIYDGTSAVMLSAESASGKFPVQAVRFMDRIVRRSEADIVSSWEYKRSRRRRREAAVSVSDATVKAAAYAAVEADARLIAVFTESGATAQLLAAERTPTRVVAFSPFKPTVRRLSLVWGVTAIRVSRVRTSNEMTLEGERILRERKLAKRGDRIVVVFGTSRNRGATNIMTIRTLE